MASSGASSSRATTCTRRWARSPVGKPRGCVFCRIMAQKPNVLVLDEPTNHLDLESIQALVAALLEFEGTLLFVSHDRAFVSALATRILEVTPRGLPRLFGNVRRVPRARRRRSPRRGRGGAPRKTAEGSGGWRVGCKLTVLGRAETPEEPQKAASDPTRPGARRARDGRSSQEGAQAAVGRSELLPAHDPGRALQARARGARALASASND